MVSPAKPATDRGVAESSLDHLHVRPGRRLADGKPALGTLKTRRPHAYETFRLVVLEPDEKA